MKQAKINKKIVYFCNNHNTTKLSNKFDSKGRKKKMSFCEAKIIYDKSEKKFFLMNGHSDLCNKIQYPKYENSLEIEKEINNYENLKITVENVLKNNIFITFKRSILIIFTKYMRKVNIILIFLYQWLKINIIIGEINQADLALNLYMINQLLKMVKIF